MRTVAVKIDLEWEAEQTQCQSCMLCNDTIYSSVYRLVFMVNDKANKTEMVICESCNELVK